MSDSPTDDDPGNALTPVNVSVNIQEIDNLNDKKKTLALTVELMLRYCGI